MPLSTIIKTGANVRSTTSANPKLRKSMEKQRNLFLYFQRMPLPVSYTHLKANNIELISKTMDRTIELVKNEQSLPMSQKRKEKYD